MWLLGLRKVTFLLMQKQTFGKSERTVEGIMGAAIAGCLALILRESLARFAAPLSLSIGGYMKEMPVGNYWAIRFRELLTWDVWGICLLLGGLLGVAAYWIMTLNLSAKQSMAFYRLWFFVSIVVTEIIPRITGFLYWAFFTNRSPLVEHWGAFLLGTGIGLTNTLLVIWLLWHFVQLSNYILERWWE